MSETSSNSTNSFVQLQVHAYNWEIRDKYVNVLDKNGDETGVKHTAIHAWCLDKESKPYLVRINEFPVFCYIQLPTYVRYRLFQWESHHVRSFMESLSFMLHEDAPIKFNFGYNATAYYYRGENRKFPMVQVIFTNLDAMKHCVNILKKPINTRDFGLIQCDVWEDNIDVVRKLLTTRNVKYSQWFSIYAQSVPEESKVSTLQNEYIAYWETMESIDPEVCKTWTSRPGILAFDIECYSDNNRAMPNKYDANHVAYMISCIYQQLNNPLSRKRYGIILGYCKDIPKDKLENCTIYQVRSEHELMEKFGEVIRETDPEVLTGYNILSFDYPYLNQRVVRELNKWPMMSRMKGEVPVMTNKNWKSGAYGYQMLFIPMISGRISIDMLPIVRRDHKLEKYDLNTVCKHFIDKSKHDISAKQMFKIYEDMKTAVFDYSSAANEYSKDPENVEVKDRYIKTYKAFDDVTTETTKVMEYCIQDSELVIELMEKLNTWISLIELSNVVGVTIVDLFTRGQQIRCLSQIYDLAARSGVVLDKRNIPGSSFKGGFVFQPTPGLYDNVICLDFASLYPNIIRAYNICYTTLVPPELMDVIPDEDCNIIEFDQDDIVDDDDDEDEANRERDIFEELNDTPKAPAKKLVNRHYKFKWYKRKQGILPRLAEQLILGRSAVRELQKGEKNAVIWSVLEARQLALKVSANSMFGFLGVQEGGKMPLIEGAMCITAKGRELIGKVRAYIEKTHGGLMIYGDTDSCMVDLKITDRTKCQFWGERLSQEISGVKKGDPLPAAKDPKTEVHTEDIPGLFPPPLRMEFEKAMRILCIAPKKYAALLVDKKGNFKKMPLRDSKGFQVKDANGNVVYSDEYEILKRGIMLARRDNNKNARKIYLKVLYNILDHRPMRESITFIVDSVQELLDGKIHYQEFVTIRELGANYKSDSFFMKVFSDRLKRDGKLVNPGDRLDFLIVETPNARLLGEKMRLLTEYLESLNTPTPFKIDYNYYLEKALMNPINQLFSIGYAKDIAKLQDIYYRPTNRHKPVYLDRIIKILHMMHTRGYKISEFHKIVMNKLDMLEQAEKNGNTVISTPNFSFVIQGSNPVVNTSPNISFSFVNTSPNPNAITFSF